MRIYGAYSKQINLFVGLYVGFDYNFCFYKALSWVLDKIMEQNNPSTRVSKILCSWGPGGAESPLLETIAKPLSVEPYKALK